MVNYKRTAIERETIINYNNEEDTANVYTWHKALINKLSSLVSTRDDIQCKYADEECASFVVPKSWIKVSPPKTRNLTDEQRAKAAERMRNMRKPKNTN